MTGGVEDELTLVTTSERRKYQSAMMENGHCPTKNGHIHKTNEAMRPLGLWEQVFVISQKDTGMHNVSSHVIISSKTKLKSSHIQQALQSVSQRHPLLRSHIVTENGTKYFKTNSGLQPVIEYSDSTDGGLVMGDEILKTFDGDKQPLWRVKCLKSEQGTRFRQSFVFTFHHAIVDGTSIVQVYRDFITYLEMLSRDMTYDVTSLSMKPSRDVVFEQQSGCSVSEKIKFTCGYLFSDFVSPTVRHNQFMSRMIRTFRPSHVTRRSKNVEIVFTTPQTDSIIKACKTHHTRVNGFCSVVAARALRQILLQYDVIKPDDVINVNTECYVNMRRNTDTVKNEDIGLYMTHLPIPVQLSKTEESIWTEAQQHDTFVHGHLDKKQHLEDFRQYQSAIRSLGPKTISKLMSVTDHRSMPYYISNIGNIVIKPEIGVNHNLNGVNCQIPKSDSTMDSQKPNTDRSKESCENPANSGFKTNRTDTDGYNCEIEELHETVGEHMVLSDGSVFIHCICTVNGKLCWTLGYHAHQVSDDVAHQLASVIKTLALEETES